MKKYFYSDGIEKHGPFSLDELKYEGIKIDTLIWFEGLEDWTPANDVDELRPILELIPPPLSKPYSQKSDIVNTSEVPPKIESAESNVHQTVITKQGMFSKPFSFDGRIRRTEFGFSLIIYFIVYIIVLTIVESGEVPIIGIAFIPMLWFLWAQGAKRCHDMGQSGWFQIIPFYVLWMIFSNGESKINEYGINPKS